MRGRAGFAVLVVLVALVGRPAHEARGENFLVRKLKGAGRAIGGILGAPVGGFAEAAATPTIRSAEGTGRRLLYDFEGVAARRMDQAATLVEGVVDKTFVNTGNLVGTIDASLEARILQVTTSANVTIDNVGEEARATIGAADRMIANNIARARKATLQILDRVDKAAADRLAQIDEILRLRLGDVGQLVHNLLAQVDEIAKARIDQLDEVAGRRIGNLDVVATKQTLSIEAMLLRLAALLGAFFFFAFLMWTAWVNFVRNSNVIDTIRENGTTREERRTIQRKLGLWALQTAFALACFAAVVGVAYVIPKDAERRSAAQVSQHSTALVNAARVYDFTAVRYHHSQLEILRPGDARFRGIAGKAELLRDLFGRPARLHTAEGLREVEAAIEAARALIPDDPDLLVIEAYVIWQVGTSRGDELDAADLCAQALAMRPAWETRFLPTRFMLRPLAESYIRNFRHDPYEPTAEEREAYTRVTAARVGAASRLEQLQQVFAYNELVATLDRKVGPAYLAMLDAHAAYERLAATRPYTAEVAAQVTTALAARTAQAELVVQAWEDFDQGLARSPWLAGDPATLNAFTLDDSVLSHALYFWDDAQPRPARKPATPARPTAASAAPKAPVPTMPPRFFDGQVAATPAKAEDDAVRRRAAAAPMRIRWANRWSLLLGKTTQDVLAKEEAERFRALEARSLEFATAYVAFRKAAAAKVDAKTIQASAAVAARTGAAMGLFAEEGGVRIAASAKILAEAAALGAGVDDALKRAVDELGRARRLRFL